MNGLQFCEGLTLFVRAGVRAAPPEVGAKTKGDETIPLPQGEDKGEG